MKNDVSPKLSKSKGKQPELRYFMAKRMKSSLGNSFSSPAPPNEVVLDDINDSPLSPLVIVPQNEGIDLDISCSSNSNVPLDEEEEWIYDAELLPHDPGKRKSIMEYPPKQRNAVRRAYILKKPFQPMNHVFPQREVGGLRRFSVGWFKKWDWLEYSIEKDAAFCFACYLFKNEVEKYAREDAFVSGGFRSWNKPDRFDKHVGGVKSVHNLAYEKYVNLRDANYKLIYVALDNASGVMRSDYELRLKACLTCLRFLLCQGLAFRGHNESEESYNRGNFLELLKWLGERCEDIKNVTFENAPKTCQLTSPMIQKDIISCCAKETTKRIIEELGDDYFGILADMSCDVSHKEHLALVLRYVDKKSGSVVERFLGIVHVGDTTALSLKEAILCLLKEHSLSLHVIRGQGYEGASNMKDEINDLKTLIMNDIPRAYYVHCFSHQLQSSLVAVAKNNDDCGCFFFILANLLNVIEVSCKRREMIGESQAQTVAQALEVRELDNESGLNRPEDARWGSHYKSILNIIHLFPTIVDVLVHIGKHVSSDDKIKAQMVLGMLETFDFVFVAHLMLTIFGYTNDLCIALQRKEQDIVNAMGLVSYTKRVLQKMKENGWETLLNKVTTFCTKHGIVIPAMDSPYVPEVRSRRFVEKTTSFHHFRVEVFLRVIDLHIQELDNRFNGRNMELLTCMACLSPKDNFSSFDKEKVLKLATFYPEEFSDLDIMDLEMQLDVYMETMLNDNSFRDLHDLNSLSMKLVETKLHETFPSIFLLIKLMLILPVDTASVERVLSATTCVKRKLKNSMGDQLMNDCLVTFIEKDLFQQVADEDLIVRFQNIMLRRMEV